MALNAFLALAAGMIWDQLGPHYVFLAFILIDLLLRAPLLMSMPETLKLRLNR
jgi:hypothetical protein